MAYQKTIKRDKELQREVNEYKKNSDMPISHALAVIFGNRMKKGKR